MGSLFNPPKAPAPPPPPPNPQKVANPNESITGVAPGMTKGAGNTVLTSPTGTAETPTTGKTLLGQ